MTDETEREPGPEGLWKIVPLTPVLQQVKDRFPAGSEWLWEKCNEHLDPDFWSLDMALFERVRALELVLNNPYPPRPPESLASSESVDKLRKILVRAPRFPESYEYPDEVEGIVEHETWHPEWDVWYDWNRDYKDEVLGALIRVVEQLGAGDEGWASARWEVYDTYSSSISGLFYDTWKGRRWNDRAKIWLDASMIMGQGSEMGAKLYALIANN